MEVSMFFHGMGVSMEVSPWYFSMVSRLCKEESIRQEEVWIQRAFTEALEV
jgi:hypothetical protein